jgi:hypothetical protein
MMARGNESARDIAREIRQARQRGELSGGSSGGSSGGGGGGGSSTSTENPDSYTPGQLVGGSDRKLSNGGAVVDGRYIPPGLNLGGLGGGTPAPTTTTEQVSQDEYLKALQEQQAAQAAAVREEQRTSAKAVIQNLMAEYGLTSLSKFVEDMVFKEDIIDPNVLLGRIRQTTEYKDRFKGIELRRAKGLNVPSEAEYIGLENTYRQLMRTAAIPANLFDQPDDLANLIGNDVSPAELSARINDGYQAVAQANPEVVTQMRRLYGLQDGELAAYFLDPERATPYLLRQARSAQIAGEAKLQAGQELTMTQAEQLATAGVTQEQAQQGFQTIAQSQELFNPLAGTTEATIGVEEQIAGIFGQSAAAQQRIRQRQRERQAAFEAGGRFAGQGGTVTGLQ